MDFLELVQAVHDLDLAHFTVRYRHPFLLEEDPEQLRRTRDDGEATSDDGRAPVRRVFEVVRCDGEDGVILIGRSPVADVRLDDRTISSRHAALKRVSGDWLLTDLHSTNGTRVNDAPVPPEVEVPLPIGSTVRFGPDLRFNFFESSWVHVVLKQLAPGVLGAMKAGQRGDKTDEFPLPRTLDHAPIVAPVASEALDGVELVVRCDPLPPVPLPRDRDVSVGRTETNEVVLPHPTVSRRHATLRRQGDVVLVRDLGSANGTLIGGRRVMGEGFAEPGGPPVVIGQYELTVERASAGTCPRSPADLRGRLETMPLADFLQLVELNARTGTIRIESPDGTRGEIFFATGAPHHAACGSERGVDAVLRLLRLNAGEFVYSPNADVSGDREIEGTFMKILLDASRASDEGGRTWVGPGKRRG